MRNLKKVLALVLALAMVLTMFAGAVTTTEQLDGFADLSKPAHQEAALVLTALGIARGTGTGINGNLPLTRAQAAKLVYAATTADVSEEGVDAPAYYNTSVLPYSDMNQATWANGVINWATSFGVLAGYGDGTVKPNDYVTGVEFAKMLLVALGYNPTTNGLVGANWANNTIRLASNLGILKEFTGNIYAELLREDAYLMTKNALYTNVYGSTTTTLGEKAFDLLDTTAVLVANDAKDAAGKNGNSWLTMTWGDDSVANTQAITYTVTPAGSGLSRFVYRDYIVENAANNYGHYDYKVITADVETSLLDLGSEYRILTTGLANEYSSSEIRTVYGVLENTNGYSSKEATVDSAASLIVTGATFVNGMKANSLTAAQTAGVTNTTATSITKDNNLDGKVDTVFIHSYALGIVSAVAADGALSLYTDNSTATVKAGYSRLDTLESEVAVGDYVMYYNDGIKYNVKKLDVFESAITAVNKVTGKENWTLSNGTYTKSGLITDRAEKFLESTEYALGTALYTFVTDGTYIVDVMVNTNTQYGNYALIATEPTTNAGYLYMPYVRLFTADNQFQTYTIATINGRTAYEFINQAVAAGVDTGLKKGVLVYYVADGTNVHITLASDTAATKDTDGNTALPTTAGTWYAEDATGIKFDNVANVWFTATGEVLDTNAAVVFAVDTANATTESSWKAYKAGEFVITKEVSAVKADVLGYNNAVYTSKTVKAMKVELAAGDIPGSVLGVNGQIVIATGDYATSVSFDPATMLYTYTMSSVGDASTVTFKSYAPLSTAGNFGTAVTFEKGHAYKLNTDANGIVLSVEKITAATTYPAGGAVLADNAYFQVVNADVTSFNVDAYGKTVIVLDTDKDGNGDKPITIATGATVYTVKNLASSTAGYTFGTYTEGNLWSTGLGAYLLASGAKVQLSGIYNAAGEFQTVIINVIKADA